MNWSLYSILFKQTFVYSLGKPLNNSVKSKVILDLAFDTLKGMALIQSKHKNAVLTSEIKCISLENYFVENFL